MANIVERLKIFNQDRQANLLPIKYREMRTDIFAFYRGTCHLFYEDWSHNITSSPLNDAPAVWICGDLHWQNLGSYKGANHLVYFNVNDFDEAVLAPFTWDFARLLTSLFISTHILDIKESHMPALSLTFLNAYTKELAKRRVRSIEEDKTRGIVRDLIFQVRRRSQKAFLDRYTILNKNQRKLRLDGTHLMTVNEAERQAITELIGHWGQSQVHLNHPHFYQVLDVAHRIAGIGSLGVKRYAILVEGKGGPDQNELLDLKAAVPSSLQPYLILPQPQWENEAERVTKIQYKVQGITPSHLTDVGLYTEWYRLRELLPEEDKINASLLHNKEGRLEKLLITLGQVLTWDHLRSSGWKGAAVAGELLEFTSTTGWQKELTEYAQSYAQQVAKDYAEFSKAYDANAFHC